MNLIREGSYGDRVADAVCTVEGVVVWVVWVPRNSFDVPPLTDI